MKKNKSKDYYLKKYRKKNGLSQEDVARELNVARTLVSKWENGEDVNKDYQEKLAKILNINPILIECRGNKIRYYKKILKKPCIIFLYFILLLAVILFSVFSYKVLKFYLDNKDNKDNEITYHELIVDNNKYLEIYNSSIFTSEARVSFRLNVKYKVEEKQIDRVKLGYYIGDEKYYAFDSPPREFFSFDDHQWEQANVDFDYINEIVDNMFLELEFEDGKTKKVGLISYKLYSNKDKFEKKEKTSVPNEIANDYPKSQIYDKMIILYDKIKDKDERINFKYNENEISLYILVIIYYFEIKNKQDYYHLSYIDAGAEYIDKYDIKKQEQLYSYSLTKNECKSNNSKIDYCKDKDDDFIFLNDIVDYALNKVIN